MNRIIGLLSFVTLITTMTACQKKDQTVPDPSKVTFDVTAPVENITYNQGDTIPIKVDLSYISELHGYAIQISDSTTGDSYYDTDQDLHTDHFSINDNWVDNAPVAATMQLQIIAFIGNNNTQAIKNIYFKTQP